ncbi:MAG: hypothetical protein JKY00_01860 [Roseicyclus sp.]|nr:hypothetical protein [Roseicyclus sp.]
MYGDLEVANAQASHTSMAEPREDCICLAATDVRLKFQSLLPRGAPPIVAAERGRRAWPPSVEI